ncbi:hypothetical protein [Salinisphaera sp. T5B8]|uniref:hypothetical protein n=1 Tax=Salinisphaera sp. T5B8 TaxID=1304154 RepID=UPI00333E6797
MGLHPRDALRETVFHAPERNEGQALGIQQLACHSLLLFSQKSFTLSHIGQTTTPWFHASPPMPR